MQSKDLRIGNIVIGNSRGGYHYVDLPILKYLDENKSGYSPCKVCREWLIAFGFKHAGIDKKTNCPKYKFKNLTLVESNSLNYYYNNRQLRYVHEMQNLYFALNGEELELVKQSTEI